MSTSAAETGLRRTPLYDRHAAAGAKLVPFAGYEMPIQYAGIREEHLAVRTRVGIFDVSHMGQVETRGPEHCDTVISKLRKGGYTLIFA